MTPRALCVLLFLGSIVWVEADTSSNAMTPTSPSMCQVCATTGDCSRAYLDGPGQFCGNWLDRLNQRQRCCCPRDAICKVSNYACNCKRQPQNNYRPSSSSVSSLTTITCTLGILSVLGFVCWYACSCCKTARFQGSSSPAVVYELPVYPSSVPPFGNFGSYGYRGGYHRDGLNTGTGALLGGVAGIVGGLTIGHALADAGGSGYGGGGYNGAGFDAGGGDFGGDF